MAGGARRRIKADCRADTRGGSWAGIPICVINSAAYRSLSLAARATLVELVGRMNGYNNGEIGISNRQVVDALHCSPRTVVAAFAELVDRGMIDVAVEGQWKERQARQYRLTFVSTKTRPATNEYLRWTPTPKKSGASHAVAAQTHSASHAVAAAHEPASHAVAARVSEWRKTVDQPQSAASHAVALICKPCPPPSEGACEGDHGTCSNTPNAAGPRTDLIGHGERTCEQCGSDFMLDRPDRAQPRRFCSETCRRRAERSRAYQRRRETSEAEAA